jgi:hypothetical protein
MTYIYYYRDFHICLYHAEIHSWKASLAMFHNDNKEVVSRNLSKNLVRIVSSRMPPK